MKNLFRLRLMWLFMLFCMIPLWALSQNITVKGIVKDGAGESVIGASVLQRVQPMVQLQTLKEALL